MAETPNDDDGKRNKRGMLVPLLIGVVLAAGGGGAGYWAVTQGPLASETAESVDAHGDEGTDGHGADHADASEPMMSAPDVAFVPLETVVISLGPEQSARHLLVTAELEVAPDYEAEVTQLSPRVLDVLNSYLRVISISELSDPSSLARLRAQLLRRIQVVTGTGRVSDLLITQFVVN